MAVMTALIFVTVHIAFSFPPCFSNSANSLPSKNILCHHLNINTPKTSFPNASCNNKFISTVFFSKRSQNVIALRCLTDKSLLLLLKTGTHCPAMGWLCGSRFLRMLLFHRERRRMHNFSLHNHLVAIGPHVLHLLCLPTASKGLVNVGTTRVTKPAVSRLLSEIQQTAEYTVFSDALHACTACRLSNSVSPYYNFRCYLKNFNLQFFF